MNRRSLIAMLSLPVMLSMQGCCTLFGVFGCGTGIPITEVSWDSPRRALTTMLTAIRASDSKVIYESLSEGFKKANGVDGLGFAVAWEKLRDQIPGLHLAGDAEVVEHGPMRDPAGNPIEGSRRYLLDAHGYRFEVEFGSFAYWDVAVESEDREDVRVVGRYLPSLDEIVDPSPVKGVLNTRVKSPDLVGLTLDEFRYVKIGHAWKVRRIARSDD